MKPITLITIAAAVAATGAQAAPEFLTGYATTTPVAASNAFQTKLAGLGYDFLSNTALVTLSEPARIRFEVLGSANGSGDSFVTTSRPNLSYTETSNFADFFATPLVIGNGKFSFGTLGVQFQGAVDARPGQPGFGVYLPLSDAPGQYYSRSVVFGFNDRSNGGTDFDDLIVRATIAAVPEPAAWTLMITGFGLLGAAMRRQVIVGPPVRA